ncbi:MAG: tRNA isopentenyl-2-thiomethyl-A-37 hydroxylase MiaE [Polyangiaceae bacterium]
MLVGAMIEDAACERFKLLIERLDQAHDPSSTRSTKLFACEAKHYRLLVDLAVHAASEVHDEAAARAIVTARLDRLAELEGAIVAGLAKGDERATVHG